MPAGFTVLSQGVLRSAGLPIDGLLELGDADYAAAVDRWLDEPGEGLDAVAAQAGVRQAELRRRIARVPTSGRP